MTKVHLTINGKNIVASEGDNLLWVSLENDIYIPNLCALHEDEKPKASCRLCFVEIQGIDRPVTACTETIRDGMVVTTRNNAAAELAKTGFELLMASHPVTCATCAANGRCELQKIAAYLKVSLKTDRFEKILHNLPVDASHPRFIFEPDKCVLCGKCIRICRRKGCGVLGFSKRGFNRLVSTFRNLPLGESNCFDCEECVAACPTGAFVHKVETV